jgi:hypothetical protein
VTAAAPVEAWFGCWSCECTVVTRTPREISEQCPTHGAGLLANEINQRRIPLSIVAVAGYGIRDKNGDRVEATP